MSLTPRLASRPLATSLKACTLTLQEGDTNHDKPCPSPLWPSLCLTGFLLCNKLDWPLPIGQVYAGPDKPVLMIVDLMYDRIL